MNSKTSAGNSCIEKGGEVDTVNQPIKELSFGDLLWVKLNRSSWWPAQVVDENWVSGTTKPGKRSEGQVLVRLYGSYKYLYVDPNRSRREFAGILKVYGGSHIDIFKEALEQEMGSPKSGKSKSRRNIDNQKSGRSNGKRMASNGKMEEEAPQDRTPKKRKTEETPAVETPNSKYSLRDRSLIKKKKKGNWDSKKTTGKRTGKGKLEETPKSPKSILKEGNRSLAGSPGAKSNGEKKTGTTGLNSEIRSTKSKEPSVRRIKVMRALGLLAPSGSPFHRKTKHFTRLNSL